MALFTIQLEVGTLSSIGPFVGDVVYQATHEAELFDTDNPPENAPPGAPAFTDAQDLADWVASNQTLIEGESWRVNVWVGDADTSTPPDACTYSYDW